MAGRISSKASETSPEILMLGYICVKEVEGLSDKIDILDRFGLADVDIATICKCGVQAVRNSRAEAKKKGPKVKTVTK